MFLRNATLRKKKSNCKIAKFVKNYKIQPKAFIYTLMMILLKSANETETETTNYR